MAMETTTTNWLERIHPHAVPDEHERLEIRRSLFSQQAALQDVQLEIIRVEALLQSLHLRRDHLQESISAHHAILAPFKRLPPELYGHIFSLCFSTPSAAEASLKNKDWTEEEKTRSQLRSVCRYWREVIDSSPLLWSSIRLTKKNLEVAYSWLLRSRSVPLTLCFHELPWGASPSIYDFLLHHTHRVRELCLYNLSPCSSKVFAGTCFPELQRALIRSPRGPVAVAAIAEMLNTSPSLYSLTWESGGDIPMNLNWHNLTDITIGEVHVDDALSILREAADVVVRCDLTLSSHQPTFSLPVDGDTITMTALRDFSLSFDRSTTRSAEDDRRPSFILDSLSSPILSSASFYSEDFWFSAPLASFLKRSKCTLRGLSLGGTIFPINFLSNLLLSDAEMLNNTLLKLCVRGGCILSEAIKLLTTAESESGGEAPLLPKLKELELDAVELFWAKVPLSAMLKSRKGGIKRVRVRSGCAGLENTKGLLEYLRSMEGEGFPVVLDDASMAFSGLSC